MAKVLEGSANDYVELKSAAPINENSNSVNEAEEIIPESPLVHPIVPTSVLPKKSEKISEDNQEEIAEEEEDYNEDAFEQH